MESFSNEMLDLFRGKGDPKADQVIESLYRDHPKEEIKKLYSTLLGKTDKVEVNALPAIVRDFFEREQVLPDWADPFLMVKAEEVFLKKGPEISMALLCRALPLGYVGQHIVKVLTSTGYLARDFREGSAKRLMETTQFLFDVMASGAMQPGQKGMLSTLKVRLIHAFVRYHLKQTNFNSEIHGLPVNQEDMAGTILTFSISALDGMANMNVLLTEEEEEAYVHFWAVVGHVIGLENELNPRQVGPAQGLFYQILDRQAAPSPEGQQLTRVLSDFLKEILSVPLIEDFPDYLIRFLIGKDEYADMLALQKPDSFWTRGLNELSIQTFRSLNASREINPVNRKIVTYFNQYTTHRLVEYFQSEFNLRLEIDPTLVEHWNLGRIMEKFDRSREGEDE